MSIDVGNLPLDVAPSVEEFAEWVSQDTLSVQERRQWFAKRSRTGFLSEVVKPGVDGPKVFGKWDGEGHRPVYKATDPEHFIEIYATLHGLLDSVEPAQEVVKEEVKEDPVAEKPKAKPAPKKKAAPKKAEAPKAQAAPEPKAPVDSGLEKRVSALEERVAAHHELHTSLAKYFGTLK